MGTENQNGIKYVSCEKGALMLSQFSLPLALNFQLFGKSQGKPFSGNISVCWENLPAEGE